MAGNAAVADLLIKNGANITTIDFTRERVLLHLANKEELVRCLMSNGVNFNVVDSESGLTFLHIAAKTGKSTHKVKQKKVHQILY